MALRQTNAQRMVLRMRKIAALRELADLGMWNTRAAQLLGVSGPNITQLAKAGGITLPKKPHGTELHGQIKMLYAQGLGPTHIGAILNRPSNSIKVLICRLEIGDRSHDPYRYMRGFGIPADLRDQWRDLRYNLRLTADEAGIELKLIQRPTLENQLRAEA